MQRTLHQPLYQNEIMCVDATTGGGKQNHRNTTEEENSIT